jgi:Predicted transcriptional regulators
METNKAKVTNLVSLRKAKGLTQEQLASAIGVSRVTLARWETGEFQPSLDYLITLSQYFRVSIDYLVGKEGANGNAAR